MIAIIDDGVCCTHYPQVHTLCFDLTVKRHNKIVPSKKMCHSPTHGTNCAGIIKKYAPDAPIGSICIFQKGKEKSTPNRLIAALEWCLNHDIDVINISIGFTALVTPPRLDAVIQALHQKGVAIFAAYSNQNVYTLPSCMENVFGVKANPSLEKEEIYQHAKNPFDVSIIASGRHFLLKDSNQSAWVGYGNSYACALVSAHYWNYIKRGGKKNTFLYSLPYHKPTDICSNVSDEKIPIICVKNTSAATENPIIQICRKLNKKGYRAVYFSYHAEYDRSFVFRVPEAFSQEDLTASAEKLKLSIAFIECKKNNIEYNGSIILNGRHRQHSNHTFVLPQHCNFFDIKMVTHQIIQTY